MTLLFMLLLLPLLVMVLYLDVLSTAAVLHRARPRPATPRNRFALLIPAHNEQLQLPRLLHSIALQDYPQQLCDVHVVADNCTDRTALIARTAGAAVHERHENDLLGKGYALHWLIDRIRESGEKYDALIIVDADSVISPNFLRVMNNHLERGDQVVQSYDGVLNQGDSWVSTLSFVALALFNHLRPLGRDALGLSAGLHGNGMCFTTLVIDRFGWATFGLAEDSAYHVQLVAAGIRVRYAPEASVLAEQPSSLKQAYSQGVRWERGRFQLLSPYLLIQGIRQRHLVPLDAFAEQVIPPFSLLTGIVAAAFIVTGALHLVVPWLLAAFLVIGEVFYVVTGLRLVGANSRIYVGLLAAPIYMAWKLWIILVAALRSQDSLWVRTARPNEES